MLMMLMTKYSGEDCRRCLRPQVRGRTSTLRPRLRQGSLQGDTFYINIQIEGQISVSTWRIFLHLTTDGHVSRSATTSQNSRRPHQASPWTPRLDRTIFRYCLKHALYIYHFTIMYDDHIHLCKYLLPLKKDSILVSQVPEKKCENRPVMLPRVKCEEVVVSRLHCWYS